MEIVFIIGLVVFIAFMALASTFIFINYVTIKKLEEEIETTKLSTETSFESIRKKIGDTYYKLDNGIRRVSQEGVKSVQSLKNKIYKDLDIKRNQSRQY